MFYTMVPDHLPVQLSQDNIILAGNCIHQLTLLLLESDNIMENCRKIFMIPLLTSCNKNLTSLKMNETE